MTRTILERAVEEYLARERQLVRTIPEGEARERFRRHVERNAREALAQLASIRTQGEVAAHVEHDRQ